MMRDCPDGLIRDELPAYVLGTLAPAELARVAAHVQSCAECAAEVELLKSIASAYRAPAIDAKKISAGVRSQVGARAMARASRAPSARWSVSRWQAAAAIVVVVIGSATVWKMRNEMNALPTVASTPQPVTGATDTATPVRQVASLPTGQPGHAAEVSFGGGLSDLSDAQLKSLLASLDRVETSPASDPETIARPILPDRTDPSGGRQQ